MAEKEYIEREEVREAFRMEFDNDYADGITDKLPTADVQEVVRCKDCRWRGTEECSMYYRCNCGEQHTWETDNDFCSCGERLDGDNNV